MSDYDQRADTGASFRQSKRELWYMLGAWVVAFLWVVGYAMFSTYSLDPGEPLDLVFGIPKWVFYGWLLPLLTANVYTLWFCLRFMKDEPMEELPGGE